MDNAIHSSSHSESEKPDHSDREHTNDPPAAAIMDPEKEDGAVQDRVSVAPDPRPASIEPHPVPNGPRQPPTDPIPNGGTQAWLQVIGSWVTLVATWGLVNTYGVYQAYYETNLLASSSASSISWIGSLQACLLMLVGVVAGPLYDSGYFRHLLIVGLFLVVFGQFMTSLGREYWHILMAQGVCTGVGM